MNKQIIHWIKDYVNTILWWLDQLYYHQYEHTLEVVDRSIELWIEEWLNENDLEILAIAALFHDTWFIIQYENNENYWASIAKNYLKSILYPKDKIKLIQNIILSTSSDKKAENIYEKILKDADTDNLWRDDFFEKWERLRKEIETIKKIKILDPDWCHYSIKFLKEHQFLTITEISQRQQKKEENIKKLENQLKEFKK